MTEKKKVRHDDLSMPFDEAVARFANPIPAELAETLASDVLKGRERATKRIEKARQEIKDGARPQKGRFRL